MRKLRLVCTLVIIMLLLVSASATIFYQKSHSGESRNSYDLPLDVAPHEENPVASITPTTFLIDENFQSHLPIVVIDTGDIEPPISAVWDMETMCYLPIKGLEPYVNGNLSIYNKTQGMNTPFQTPTVTSDIRIKRRGNSSMALDKAQWFVKLITDSGQSNDLNLLGMGEDNEWILNGTMMDKSLLRNYLSYRTASEILPYTPDARYCEVLIKTSAGYRYEGMYLLGENIKQGPNRVDINPFAANSTFNSYLLRRDRYDEEGIMLNNYGRLEGYAAEYLGILYPNKLNITPTMIQYVESDINAIEKVLYSDDLEVFRQYPDVIDVDSFIDYFLLNEYFISYDAGNFSTYMYKDLGGKLSIGPVWDFDGTMDNYVVEPVDVNAMAFHLKPWFDRLTKDTVFVNKLEKRYAQLARTALSTSHILQEIDEITLYLGGAIEREWMRWEAFHTTSWEISELTRSLKDYVTEDGVVLHRNASTHQQEIYRIKVALQEHSRNLPKLIEELHMMATFDTGLSSWMGTLLFISLLTIFIPAIYVAFRK